MVVRYDVINNLFCVFVVLALFCKGMHMYSTLKKITIFCSISLLTGCAGLLPHGKQEATTPWKSYEEARVLFDKVTPMHTSLNELKQLGIDPDTTPNVALLSQTELLRKFATGPMTDIQIANRALLECLNSDNTCFAYEVDQTYTERKRYGNFFLDLFNFKRNTEISGWQFGAIFIIQKNRVVYKVWSGKPRILQHEEEHNPLGPLQNLGNALHY